MPNDRQSHEDTVQAQTRPQSVYLSLGSNLGDREANLHEAVDRIRALGLEVTQSSSIYETEPVGYKEQPWFLNQVVEVRVALEVKFASDAPMAELIKGAASENDIGFASSLWVYEFHKALQKIEHQMGRERTIADGPRIIDIDVLLCAQQQGFWSETRSDNLSTAIASGKPFLVLPHPRMHERRFVLEPLCEIAPDLIHPVLKKTCRELLAELNDPSTVTLFRKRHL